MISQSQALATVRKPGKDAQIVSKALDTPQLTSQRMTSVLEGTFNSRKQRRGATVWFVSLWFRLQIFCL